MDMRSHNRARIVCTMLAALLVGGLLSGETLAATKLKNVCRVKGQEENTLHGLGLVVGLNGTGDGGNFLPAIRSLATALQLMGNPVGPGGGVELKDAKNVALVTVSVTIPAAGARQGDKLDCVVSSIGSAKSLAGGRLFITPLQGPDVESTRIFGFAEGLIQLDDAKLATTGRIFQGCRLEEDFYHPFVKDSFVTLVLDANHADFEVAQAVADTINRTPFGMQSPHGFVARAINQQNVKVYVLPQYENDPVDYISQLMGLELLLEPEVGTDARVVINERSGSIVIDGDIEIGAVVVTHKNILIETAPGLPGDRFVGFHPEEAQPPTRLRALVEALNAVKVPNEDIIDIIKRLDRSGKLHGKLIIE